METRININDQAFRQTLGQITVKLDKIRPLLQDVGEIVLDSIITCFEDEVDPDRSPWADLAPSTLDRKRRIGQPNKKLIATGAGERSIEIDYVGKSVRVQYGRGAEYMRFHPTGTKKMDKRNFIPSARQLESSRLKSAIERYLKL